MDWSLIDCGRKGHLTYAPSEADVRRQLRAQAESGEAWRCLRCGAFVSGGPQMSGPAADAPLVRRGKEVRSALILRVFAVERFLRALAVAAIAFVVWRFEYNIDNSKLVGLFNRALTLSPTTIKLLAIALACYAAIEVVEGVGLWVGRRWGEYFAMVATSVGLPFEIYDLVNKVSAIGFILFAINLFLVLYLVITKRLFGVRGGKRAYDARLRSESIMDAAIAAAAADHHTATDHTATDRTAAATQSEAPTSETPASNTRPAAPTPDGETAVIRDAPAGTDSARAAP